MLVDHLELVKEINRDQEEYGIYWNENTLKELADSRNCDVIFSEPNLLLLDLDDENNRHLFDRNFHLLLRDFTVVQTEHWESRNGNSHCSILLKGDLPLIDRLLLQAALGSDSKKEYLSYMRYRLGVPERACSVLFKPRK